MKYYCVEYREKLPSGGDDRTTIGGRESVVIPKNAYFASSYVLPTMEYRQVYSVGIKKDNGIYPVWRAADGRVYLTWDDIGDAHLVDIRQYLEMVHRNENTGMTPLPYRTVKHELQKRGLDNR
jgi:hypothetical protein